jgi:hypothetical protein
MVRWPGAGPARSDLGERWPSRLVATAAEDRLNISPAWAFERIID